MISYMFWGHENVSKISKKLDELYGNPHSGATWGYAMQLCNQLQKMDLQNGKIFITSTSE